MYQINFFIGKKKKKKKKKINGKKKKKKTRKIYPNNDSTIHLRENTLVLLTTPCSELTQIRFISSSWP